MNINDIPATTTTPPITDAIDNPDGPTPPGFVSGPARRNRKRLLLAAPVAIAAGALGVLLVGQVTSAPTTSGAAQLEPRSAPGIAPFTSPVGTDQTSPNVGGATPGTPVCDSRSLIGQLQADPVKAGAWASVFGIGAGDIPLFVTGLTPVVLRADTAVTDHGYRDGTFTAYPAVLQAGTAAFVSGAGTPTVKCFSGDPLTGVTERPTTYVGTGWAQFQPDTITIVTSTNVVNGLPGGLAGNPSGGRAGNPGTSPAHNVGGGIPGGGTSGAPGGTPGTGGSGGGSPGGGSPGGPNTTDPYQQAYDAAKAAADAAHAALTQFDPTLNTDIDTAKAADKALASADAALQKAAAAEKQALAAVNQASQQMTDANTAYLNAKAIADNDTNPLTKLAETAVAAALHDQSVQADDNWKLKMGAESVTSAAKKDAQADFDKAKTVDQRDNATVQSDWATHYKQEGAAAQADRDLATAKSNLDQHKKDNSGGQQAQSLNSVQRLGGLNGAGSQTDQLTGPSTPSLVPGGSTGNGAGTSTGTGSGPAAPGGSSGKGGTSGKGGASGAGGSSPGGTSSGGSSSGGTSSGGSSSGGTSSGGKSSGNTTGSGTAHDGTSGGMVGKNMTHLKVDLSPVEK